MSGGEVPPGTTVGLLGHGAIGRVVADALRDGRVRGHRLGGVVTRRRSAPDAVPDVATLVARCGTIIEVAGQDALASHGPTVVAAGRLLVVVSVGALADPVLRDRLAGGPGRVRVPSGALGGLDALRSAARDGGLDEVALTTTKPATALLEPWMPTELRNRLREATTAVEAFAGSAAEAVRRFPRSVNVAATLALATLGFERTRVRVLGDPGARGITHRVEAVGSVGVYRFELRNHPSPDNPRTSRLTAQSVVRTLEDGVGQIVVGV